MIVFLFFIVMVISMWFFPSAISIIGIACLLLSLAAAFSSIFKKQREAYRQGKITRAVFMRNVLFEIFGILLAMTFAGLLGRYIAEFVTGQIGNDLTKLITGILIGLLAGMGVGIIMKRTWGRLVKTSLER